MKIPNGTWNVPRGEQFLVRRRRASCLAPVFFALSLLIGCLSTSSASVTNTIYFWMKDLEHVYNLSYIGSSKVIRDGTRDTLTEVKQLGDLLVVGSRKYDFRKKTKAVITRLNCSEKLSQPVGEIKDARVHWLQENERLKGRKIRQNHRLKIVKPDVLEVRNLFDSISLRETNFTCRVLDASDDVLHEQTFIYRFFGELEPSYFEELLNTTRNYPMIANGSAVNITTNSAWIIWKYLTVPEYGNSGNVTETKLHWKMNKKLIRYTIESLDGSMQKYFLGGLEPGVTYRVRLVTINAEGRKQEGDAITFTAHIPPQLNCGRENHTVMEGGDYTLRCTRSGVPAPAISLVPGSAQIKHSFHFSSNSFSVSLVDVQYDPDLKFCITATNSVDSVGTCVRIIVLRLCPKVNVEHGHVEGTNRLPDDWVRVTCDDGYHRVGAKRLRCESNFSWHRQLPSCLARSPPVTELEQDVLIVRPSQNFSVACRVSGIPFPKVKWFVNGKNMEGSLEWKTSVNNSVRTLTGESRHTLTGESQMIGNHSEIRCVAVSGEGVHNSSLLAVAYDEQKETVLEGNSFNFVCPVDILELNFRWVGQKGVVSAGRTLSLNSVEVEDSGDYFCQTSQNETVWTLHLDVVGTPAIIQSDGDKMVERYYGRATKLSCEYSSRSPVSVQWLHNGQPFTGVTTFISEGKITNTSTLTIDRVTYAHDGNITCVISNGLKARSRTFFLKGIPKGSCQVYHGEECKEYLEGRKVFYIQGRHDKRLPWNVTHSQLVMLFNKAVNGFEKHQGCLFFAKRMLCEYIFPPCDLSSPIQSQWKRRICREDCRIIREELCPEEWKVMDQLKEYSNYGPVESPNCTGLPEHNGGDGPECMRSLRFHSADLQGTDKTSDCYCDKGQGYYGNRSVTRDGEICQEWNNSSPHSHPDYGNQGPWAELVGNHCRNPEGRADRPWCYTTKRKRWNYCDVQRCKHDIIESCKHYEKKEHSVCSAVPLIANNLITESHPEHTDKLEKYIKSQLEVFKNKGISPQCIEHYRALLCLQTYSVCNRPYEGSCGNNKSHVCLSYCEAVHRSCPVQQADVVNHILVHPFRTVVDSVFKCSGGYENNSLSSGVFSECIQLDILGVLVAKQAVSNGLSEDNTTIVPTIQPLVSQQLPLLSRMHSIEVRCYNADDRGELYNGTAHTTVSGRLCQPWASSRPHIPAPQYHGNLYFTSLVHNFCRNPGGSAKKPWCYTSNSSWRWEYCNVTVCQTPPRTKLSSSVSSTAIGIGVASAVFLVCVVVLFMFMRRKQSSRGKGSLPDMRVVALPSFSGSMDPNSPVALKPWPGAGASVAGQLTVSRENPEYWMTSPDLIGITKISHDDLQFLALIAEGNFGKVWRGSVKGLDGQAQTTVAIKTLKTGSTEQAERNFIKEAKVMSCFRHVNIIRLLAVGIPDSQPERPFCLLFEYMEHGDLQHFLREVQRHRRPTVDIIGRKLSMESSESHFREHRGDSQSSSSSGSLFFLNQVDLCRIAAQIAYGMQYLSQRRYVHRDLAARNCLVGKGLVVKIADFGLSRDIHLRDYYKPEANWAQLPVRWMPPEVIMYGKHTTESDVWSFGVVLWEIFTLGAVPYYELSNEEVAQRVCHEHRRLAQPPDCPSLIYGLMQECWFEDPEERPYFRRLWKVLNKWRPPQGTGTSDYASGNDTDPDEYSNPSSDEVFEPEAAAETVISPHGTRVPTDPRTSSVSAVPSPNNKHRRAIAARVSDSGNLADDSDSHSSSPKHQTKQRLPELSRDNEADA